MKTKWLRAPIGLLIEDGALLPHASQMQLLCSFAAQRFTIFGLLCAFGSSASFLLCDTPLHPYHFVHRREPGVHQVMLRKEVVGVHHKEQVRL